MRLILLFIMGLIAGCIFKIVQIGPLVKKLTASYLGLYALLKESLPDDKKRKKILEANFLQFRLIGVLFLKVLMSCIPLLILSALSFLNIGITLSFLTSINAILCVTAGFIIGSFFMPNGKIKI